MIELLFFNAKCYKMIREQVAFAKDDNDSLSIFYCSKQQLEGCYGV